MQDAFAYCAEFLRTADRDRFITTLFAPAEHRGALQALYAFNAEVARVREAAHGALPGEIRLQWWSEAIAGERGEEAQANPVAAALLSSIDRYRLARGSLLDLIEARRFDLYEEPMASLADLEAYARRTSSCLISSAAQMIAGGAFAQEAAPAGIALGLAGILRAFPMHVARRQIYVPTEILERHEIRLHDVFAERTSPGLKAALAELRQVARRHLDAARASLPTLP